MNFYMDMVTANVYKVILTDHNVGTFLSWWESSLPGLYLPSFTRHEDSQNSLQSIKIMCYSLHSHLYARFWTKVLAFCNTIKTATIFWKNGVHPFSQVPEPCTTYAKEHWSCSGSSWWPNTLIWPYVTFLLISHPSIHTAYAYSGMHNFKYNNLSQVTGKLAYHIFSITDFYISLTHVSLVFRYKHLK